VVNEIVKKTGGVGDAREWKTHGFHGWALYHLHEAIGLMPRPWDAKITDYFQLVRTTWLGSRMQYILRSEPAGLLPRSGSV